MLFLGLTTPDVSQARVTGRVAKGGHFVDRLTIEDNFSGNLEMLNIHFRFIDHLTVIDTTEANHTILVTINSGLVTSSIHPDLLPNWFKTYMPDITKLIK